MLLTLASAFALSQAYRTVAAIMAPSLQAEYGLSARSLGAFAGSFHFAFGALQLLMGIGIDVHGVRRTVLTVFPLTMVGALLAGLSDGFWPLLTGQVLIGIGCAPAFLACTVFIARHFESERFASVSGLALGVGSTGLLLTGTPLAWVIQHYGWRTGFIVLAVMSAAVWLLICVRMHEPPAPQQQPAERLSIGAALQSYAVLLRMPHTPGILALASVTYAAFLSLRGLWLSPMLIDRHGFSLVESGHVALALSVVGIFGPALFGRLDPGPTRRRDWMFGLTLTAAAIYMAMAMDLGTTADIVSPLVVGIVSGYIVFQYADVRAGYPPDATGRAMALFTMAMFLGVAVMQWLTGAVASAAQVRGYATYGAVMATIGVLLIGGALAFRLLPQPPGPSRH